MWSSSLRAALLGLTLAGTAALGGCSGLTPVYGDHGLTTERLALHFAKPQSRLEQIIYEDLALRLGRSDAADAPTIAVTTKLETRDLTLSAANRPNDAREAVVSADISVTDSSGKVVYTATRSASASYTTNGQGLADTSAAREAGERAAKELAETIRLTLLGALAHAG